MTLTAVSLFAGVGGFDCAMERQGIDVVATVEIDKAARGVLQRQFPKATHFNDVTEVTGEQLRDAGFVPERGIITGGFPCQDLSVAGKRAGLGGARSGLFWQIVRLLDELQPRFFVLENVPGLLSSKDGRDFGAVLGALVGGGYGVAYRILDAQYFGVAQRRRRVFIVGCLGDDGSAPSEILALSQGVCGDSAPSRATWEETTPDVGEGFAPSLLTMREGSAGGGKGPLVSEDVSLTLATGNGQVLIFGDGRRGHDQIAQELVPTLEARMGTGGNNVPMVFGQTGFAKYTEGEVSTLGASDYKRPEQNLVIREGSAERSS